MARLSLVIADSDTDYVDSVVNYLTDKYSKRFQIFSFTDMENLKQFFIKNTTSYDILMVSPDVYYEELANENIETFIILSNGRLERDYKGFDVINKFQSGDKLVGNLLNLFSDRNSDLINTNNDNKYTKIVGVFSISGGSGKTSLAVASSIALAQIGKNVFYLNLENVPSTSKFFQCNGENSLSHILYYLKAKNKNLGLKIEGIRAVDPIHKVHYFLPPENIFELCDVLPEEYTQLIKQLKLMSFYDVVFIDMSSSVDLRNLKILEACDEIAFITAADIISLTKTEIFISQIRVLEQKNNSDFLSKLTLILNKISAGTSSSLENETNLGIKVSVVIPKVSSLFIVQNGRITINLDGRFGDAINDFIQKY